MTFGTAPGFWWRPTLSWPARLLQPVALAYGAVARHRMRRPGECLPVPVLCIGNFTAGGAGKTPTAIAVARRLIERGERPAFLSRGHGRVSSEAAVIAVDTDRHGAAEVGDEPLLLARHAPTFVAADRRRGAEAALEAGATIIVMDDGLQNPTLRKTASIVVADGRTGVGNGACIPAGPLRAPLDAQWPVASLLCLVGAGEAGGRLGEAARRRGVPVVTARLVPDGAGVRRLSGRRLVAFTGIGRPDKFFETLRESGLDVVSRRRFPDHHVFSGSDLRSLIRDAELTHSELVTTEKDAVRLPGDIAAHVLPVRLVFDEGEKVIEALLDRLGGPHR